MKQRKLNTGCENSGSLKNIPGAHTPDQPKQQSKYYVPGFLGGHYVQANPDTGASHDMISESYATANNYHIDSSGAGVANLPGGRQAWMLGTTTLTFRFEGEETVYSRIFQVMRELSYSCILGNAFLKLTKTLSVTQNRLDRIRQVAKRITSRIPRFHLIGGTHERLQGTVNGYQVCALADTGADVNIIRRDVAKRLGLKIWSNRRHRKLLELGDGSFIRTVGTAYNAQWCFGPSGSTEPLRCEFQVLDDIPCDVILSNDFLFDSSAFELYEHYFYDASSVKQLEAYAQLNCITEVPLPEQELDEMMMDVYYCGKEEDRIAGIPSMEPPHVKRIRFRLSRKHFSRLFTGNALPNGTGGVPSSGGAALDPALPPPSASPLQPKRGWVIRVIRLVTRRSDHEASLSAPPSSMS